MNILLQGFISRLPVDDFALVSDSAYAAQNGGRIARALLEIAISRKWASVTAVLMGMTKAIEKRLWPFDQPLKQFDLKNDVFYGLETWADEWSPAELAALSPDELGKMVHLNERHGAAISNAAKQFPSVRIDYKLRPLGSDVLKIAVRVSRAFTWNTRVHGTVEPLWLWVEDHKALHIHQLSYLMFRENTDTLNVDFVISIPDSHPPPSVTIRFVSERWMGAEDEIIVSLESLVMPTMSESHSHRLDLPFLSLAVLPDPIVKMLFSDRLNHFNAIQTQCFWTLIHTKWNALLCAPTGSGKSVMAQILIWYVLLRIFTISILNSKFRSSALRSQNAWILVITPQPSVASEMTFELRTASRIAGIKVESGQGVDILTTPKGSVIRVVTSSQLLQALSHSNAKARFGDLGLVICENLDQLDPTYELGVSLLRHATQLSSTRYVGFCNSLNDPAGLSAWLDVDPAALFNFRPSDRDQALIVSAKTFTIPQSASLFKAMIKPAHTAIKNAPSGESAVVFVPSRNQCRSIAFDLITQCALEAEKETETGYLPDGILVDDLEGYRARLRDQSLFDFVSRGVGLFHERVHISDRTLMLELYAEGVIRVLIVPRDSCWSLPVRAAVVVVMGTQYVKVDAESSNHQLCDYSLSDLVRMQSRAVRHMGSGHFHLFCQAEAKDTFLRFLNEGLPLESGLQESEELEHWYKANNIQDKQQFVDVLSFTFLAQRISSNPTYYDCTSSSRDENLSRVVDRLVEKFTSDPEVAS